MGGENLVLLILSGLKNLLFLLDEKSLAEGVPSSNSLGFGCIFTNSCLLKLTESALPVTQQTDRHELYHNKMWLVIRTTDQRERELLTKEVGMVQVHNSSLTRRMILHVYHCSSLFCTQNLYLLRERNDIQITTLH